MQIPQGRLYLDANLFVYGIEDVEPWGKAVREIFEAIDLGACTAVTSELTLAECLVKPMELGQGEIVKTYLGLLQNREFLTVAKISRDILIEAARLRGQHRVRLPDAIHAATALSHHCDFLITNDERFHAVPGLPKLPLRDILGRS